MIRETIENETKDILIKIPRYLYDVIKDISKGYKKEIENTNSLDVKDSYEREVLIRLLEDGIRENNPIFDINHRNFNSSELTTAKVHKIKGSIFNLFNNFVFPKYFYKSLVFALEPNLSDKKLYIQCNVSLGATDLYNLLKDEKFIESLRSVLPVYKGYDDYGEYKDYEEFLCKVRYSMVTNIISNVEGFSLLKIVDEYTYCQVLDGIDNIVNYFSCYLLDIADGSPDSSILEKINNIIQTYDNVRERVISNITKDK